MITYDYTLRRKINETEFKEFKPQQIPNKLPNLVMIEGPNSSGKSTLLNILAMSLYGDKSSKMNPELIDKIASLKYSSHQNIVFNITITDKGGNKILDSVKESYDDEDVLLCEYNDGGKKPLTYRSFIRKYNLIYDIPSNPTERLHDLLNELRDEQLRYGSKIKYIGDFVTDKLGELENYRAPDKIAEYNTKIEECNKELIRLNNELPSLIDFSNNLENYTYLRSFLYYYSELDTLTNRLSKLNLKIKSTQIRAKRVNRKYKGTKNDATKRLDALSSKKRKITPILKKLFYNNFKTEYDIFEEINLYNITDNLIDPKLLILTNSFGTKIVNLINEIKKDEAFKNGVIYENLINVLKQYTSVDIVIPRIDITINEILNILIEENIHYDGILENYNNLNYLLADLKSIADDIETLQIYLDKINDMEKQESKIIGDDKIYDNSNEQKIYSLENEIKLVKKQLSFYSKLCISKNLDVEQDKRIIINILKQFEKNKDLKPFFTYKEDLLLTRINKIKSQISKFEKDIIQQNTLKQIYEGELSVIMSMDIHPFEEYRKELNQILPRVRTLSSLLLGKYNEMIKNLIKKDQTKIKKGEDIYHQNVFKYLGKRIGKFKHIDRDYVATYIDLINRVIKTKDNSMIYLSDMGTGQSQSAFLQGLLNTPDDKRKIIALFDEVAMMDDFSLEPVCNRLRELYDEDRLLLSVIVQKANEIKVRDLVQ